MIGYCRATLPLEIMSVLLAFLALFIERFTGYPGLLLKAIGHPVIWIGELVSWLDQVLNRQDFQPSRRKLNGIFALALVIFFPAAIAIAAAGIFALIPFGIVLSAVAASSLLAQRSLENHVAAVAEASGNRRIRGRPRRCLANCRPRP